MATKEGIKTGGRQKNVQNKITGDIKVAFKNLVEKNLDNITKWMEQVAKDNPQKALEFMHSFAQFNVPLLARQELTGKDGKELKPTTIKLTDGTIVTI